MFQYNQDSALKAGGTAGQTGAYEGTILSAVYGASEKKNTKYLELTFEADGGEKFSFLTLYYQKADGAEVKGGASMINAIMGLCKVQQLSSRPLAGTNVNEAPELAGKKVGLVFQKVLYTKIDNSDGYKFEIRLPFLPGTRQTLKEAIEQSEAKTVDRMIATLTDKDERNAQARQSAPSFGQTPQGTGFSGQPQTFGNSAASDMGFDVPDDTFGH